MKNIRQRIWHQIQKEVRKETRDRMWIQIKDQVWDGVRVQIEDQVKKQVSQEGESIIRVKAWCEVYEIN